MPYGIDRVHGFAAAPSQRPSTISFYTITFAASVTSEKDLVDGAIDRIFRTAVPSVGVVAMIGTLSNDGLTLRFAIEDTGADQFSPSFLGTGPTNMNPASTAAALQAAVQALGTVNGKNLAAATVAAFVL